MDGKHPIHDDGASDYGSDFTADDEVILNELLNQLPIKVGESSISSGTNGNGHNEGDDSKGWPRRLGRERRVETGEKAFDFATDFTSPVQTDCNARARQISILLLDPSRGCKLTDKRLVESPDSRERRHLPIPKEDMPELETRVTDLRSPLERFRSKPSKALSVTDLVSPAWCELSYFYSISRHGRVRRTPAMKRGSSVHKVLEGQVHQTVAIDINTKEDSWGLRIWNVIQGLKTLRETGQTRELEIWGVLDGLVVNGIIDELSFVCPDIDLEKRSEKDDAKAPTPDQTTTKSLFNAQKSQEPKEGVIKNLRYMRKRTSKIYLGDVKTRGTKIIPEGASFRPTLMQLMLYRLLISDLATNKVDADTIFQRYDLNASMEFSDTFIAQIGNLNETFYDAPMEASQIQHAPGSSQDSVQVLLENNSISRLWALMIEEFQRTMPRGVESIGKVLKVEYRDRNDANILGIKTFLYDKRVITEYVDDELSWWRGEREVQGVPIEESFKCRSCEFADGYLAALYRPKRNGLAAREDGKGFETSGQKIKLSQFGVTIMTHRLRLTTDSMGEGFVLKDNGIF